MKAVATFHPSTSVVASIKSTLSDDENLEFLVVAKTNALEVFAILPDSLRLQCRLEIWGRVVSLQAVPRGELPKHHLLVLTDHPDPRLILLEYDQGTAELQPALKTLKTVSLYEASARPAEFVNTCLVDHRGKVAVACTYMGKLRALELENGFIISDFDTSVRELNIISLCFLRTTNSRATVLGILYKDYLQNLKLTSHDLSISDLEISPSPSSFLPEFSVPDAEANLLIPVPPQTKTTWNTNGGVLVLGGDTIFLYSIDRKQKKKDSSATPKASGTRVPQAEVRWPCFNVTAWSQVDPDGTRFLLGDGFGQLVLLVVSLDSEKPGLDIDVVPLGEASPPTCLTPLASQYVYVGSHFGDSQLVRISADKSSANGTYVDVTETFKNIAPILDAVVEDIDGSGQPTIVTCSGGSSSGSLRIIHNGANFTEDAHIDGVMNIFGVWPLKRHYDEERHQYVLVSTDVYSHLLELPTSHHLPAPPVRSNDLTGLREDTPTLIAANVLSRVTSSSGKSEYRGGGQIVQVTRDAVVLLNTEIGTCEDQWIPVHGQKIVLADISPSQICIALSGGTVILFNILDDKIREQSRKTFTKSDVSFSDISALSITPMKSGAKFSSLVVLGFWSSRKVRVYTLPTFEQVEELSVMPHLPRSLLLHDFGNQQAGSQPYLMVGLANGIVVSMPFGGKGKLNDGDKKFFALGGAHVALNRCTVNNQSVVFACGARSGIFYRSRDAINHSPVLMKDVLSVSSLNTASFSSSMVLSTLDGLVIGRILELDKLHIRTVHMGLDLPVRLAYDPTVKTFGVGCLKQDRAFSKGATGPSSSFKLMDDVDFKTTGEFPLEVNEEILAVATVSLECEADRETYFAVGTTYFNEDEREPSRGRILILSTGTKRNQFPHYVAVAQTRGAVNAVAGIEGKLVAAINTSVDIFSLVSGADSELHRITGWDHNYLVITVVVAGNEIVVGDAVSSLAVLKLERNTLLTVTRDYSPLWPLCVGMFDQQTIIGTNTDYNLFSYRLHRRGNKMLLEQNGLYNIDETVNKCVPGCLDLAGVKFGLQTKQLLFTATGRIAVVIDVNDELSRLLSSLERNSASIIKGPGDVDHTHWRAPANSRGRSDAHATATGFLDADLLERFLDYPASSPEVTRILSGKNEAEKIDAPYRQLRAILESLRSQH